MRKTGGPKTPGGKAASSRNAVKHGLRSNAPVIPEVESFEEWDDFRDGIVAGYAPEGRLERELAEQCASYLWRKRRVPRYETEMIANFLERIPDDLVDTAQYGAKLGIPLEETITEDRVGRMISSRLLPDKDTMEKVMRYESHFHRLWLQTHHELEALQSRRKGERISSLTRIDVAGAPGLGA